MLDTQIHSVMEALRAMTEHPANKPYLYVTDEDITGLPCFAQVRMRAVRGAAATAGSCIGISVCVKEYVRECVTECCNRDGGAGVSLCLWHTPPSIRQSPLFVESVVPGAGRHQC